MKKIFLPRWNGVGEKAKNNATLRGYKKIIIQKEEENLFIEIKFIIKFQCLCSRISLITFEVFSFL